MQKVTSATRTKLIRKQLLITEEQNERLRALAAAASRSEGDLVREAIEEWLARRPAEDWKAGLMGIAGLWKDRDDIDQLYADRRERRRLRRQEMNRRMHGED